MKPFITLFIGILIMYSCEKIGTQDKSMSIYKFKSGKDYSNNVPVSLSNDRTKITSAPGPIDYWPMKLANGYYLNGTMGLNSGYLSLTKEQYNADIPGIDSMYNYLIDRDPYQEYYLTEDGDIFTEQGGPHGIDTAFLNDLIRDGKLEKYFERLK